MKKTLLTGEDSRFPNVYYYLNDGIAISCHYFKDNKTHDTCTIEGLEPAKQNTLRFKACSSVFCTTVSSSQTVWTLPSSKWHFLLMEQKRLYIQFSRSLYHWFRSDMCFGYLPIYLLICPNHTSKKLTHMQVKLTFRKIKVKIGICCCYLSNTLKSSTYSAVNCKPQYVNQWEHNV